MKPYFFLLLSFSLAQAQASSEFKILKCSNSDSTVTWSQGAGEDMAHLKYSHFVEGTLSLPLEELHIDLAQEILVKEKSLKECSFWTLSKVFASKVLITPTDKNPEVLRSLFPANKIETEVICTFERSTPRHCPTFAK